MLNLATLTSVLVATGALAHTTPPRYNQTTDQEIESQINFTNGVCTVEVSVSFESLGFEPAFNLYFI
jgi:type III secretory pathway lipoprotein EscJ